MEASILFVAREMVTVSSGESRGRMEVGDEFRCSAKFVCIVRSWLAWEPQTDG